MTVPGSESSHLVPLADVTAREEEGWELWKRPPLPVDIDGKDTHKCGRPQDIFHIDKPHLDTVKMFLPSTIEDVKKNVAPSGWEPDKPLEENYDEEDNISTAPFRPPGEWKQAQRQSHGRRVTPDMVPEREWPTGLGDIKFVNSKDPTDITVVKVDEHTADAVGHLLGKPKPLRQVLMEREAANAARKEKRMAASNKKKMGQINSSGFAGADESVV
ncbi:hypothetical protein F5Y03DRAFT_399092 [Xylaria venustula]|nr:hypothetical protein F5Y03DRAFT_399092 [Xylaria venustula]